MQPAAPWPATVHLAVVDSSQGHRHVQVRQAVDSGTVLSPLRASAVFASPGRHTLQISEHDHATPDPAELRLIDHSCAPNARFDLERGELVTIAAIAAGQPVTVFYPATEWTMAEPFACHCGAPACLGVVRGASALAAGQLRRYDLSRHIARLLLRREGSATIDVPPSAKAAGRLG